MQLSLFGSVTATAFSSRQWSCDFFTQSSGWPFQLLLVACLSSCPVLIGPASNSTPSLLPKRFKEWSFGSCPISNGDFAPSCPMIILTISSPSSIPPLPLNPQSIVFSHEPWYEV
ncbi:uncharacterized protein LOC108341214 [Vigna angularis]|uniref:uncharacterized protein LOC108341214 n=1 Tax=Phaseolus angularis TaxID=3914 RepID=UPI000809B8A9|nr:uncharacterized protein LOC108341214 [Vigna angularis]